MSLTELPGEPEPLALVIEDDVLDTLAPAFPAADVDDLRISVHGPVYAAGDDGLAAEVATWNVAIQHTPAIAVGATCAADVWAAVSWAVAHDLRVAVQATGHGPVAQRRRLADGHHPPDAGRRHRPRRGASRASRPASSGRA